jgi:protein SCO1/2
MKRVLLASFASLLLLVAVMVAGRLVLLSRLTPPTPSPLLPLPPVTQTLWPAPDFDFVDQDSRPLTRRQLDGHVWIADFIYTQCRSACPLLTARMVMLQRQLARYDVRFVSFSVDPAHDTPAALKAYAAQWHGDETRWRLLATTPAALHATAAGMRVLVAATTDARDPILHSDRFLLVDGAGMVRGAYDSGDADELARLVADATKLPGVTARAPADHVPTSGTALYDALGCRGCHARPEVAPSLAGLFGGTVTLAGGRRVVADEAYVRAAIVAPTAELVDGYGATMPSYAAQLTDAQLTALVDYLRALPADGAIAKARRLVVDPVCKMAVSVGESDLHVDRGGKRYWFCSDTCRDKFLATPTKYVP